MLLNIYIKKVSSLYKLQNYNNYSYSLINNTKYKYYYSINIQQGGEYYLFIIKSPYPKANCTFTPLNINQEIRNIIIHP